MRLLKCAKNPGIQILFKKSGSWIRFFFVGLRITLIINYSATAPFCIFITFFLVLDSFLQMFQLS